jgi:curved DNA-binding protein CbpA
MKNWFTNPQTLEELKKQYKKLVFANHPDRGGRVEDMQEINAEYEKLFKL